MGLLTGFGRTGIAHDDDNQPSREQIASAKRTSDLLFATLFAALTQEFDETEDPEDPTVDNVGEGKRSISLVFNNRNKDMRLVGTFDPLQATNRPSDAFERTAHGLARMGRAHTAVQRVDDQWYYRRSIPLSNFRAACALCHTNFPSVPSDDHWVGALMLRVPIE
jgi:hypothetical protein